MIDDQTSADSPIIPENSRIDKKPNSNLTAGIIFDSQEDLDTYKLEQAQKLSSESSPTIPPKSPTVKTTGRKSTPTKNKNSPTAKQGAGLNKIKQEDLVKWTVFVQEETKSAVSMAAAKAGTTITDWLDSRLRQVASDELTKKPKPPAKVEDVADLMTQLEKRLSDQQAEVLKAQGDQMQEIAAAIKNQPTNLKEWIFGKKKTALDKK